MSESDRDLTPALELMFNLDSSPSMFVMGITVNGTAVRKARLDMDIRRSI
jgi:hypothetical protein